ncbi:PilZ domain-containing protein [Marinobacter fonticola]|uniref:PilZ domain-containing protein n=1 Tax=Marinobacter fonticola TaxID=2603215 RepID=UPI0011E7DA4A|nr:PilZ domain-containing protein [Marinobacter fonticola]
MQMPSKNKERRRFRRLPAAELRVAWRPRKGLFGSYSATESHDFTREGLSIIERSDCFEIGDRLELRLELWMEASTLSLERIQGEIVNRQTLPDAGSLSRFGIAFNFTGSRLMRSQQTRAQLGRIEGILERSEKLRLRLQPLEHIRGLAEQLENG